MPLKSPLDLLLVPQLAPQRQWRCHRLCAGPRRTVPLAAQLRGRGVGVDVALPSRCPRENLPQASAASVARRPAARASSAATPAQSTIRQSADQCESRRDHGRVEAPRRAVERGGEGAARANFIRTERLPPAENKLRPAWTRQPRRALHSLHRTDRFKIRRGIDRHASEMRGLRRQLTCIHA